MSNSETEFLLREILKRENYKIINPPREKGELGVDILAEKNNQQFFIECIGYKKAGPSRSKDFYEVFFRAISRLNNAPNNCSLVIAVPFDFQKGINSRVKQYQTGWERIGIAFPELQIWFINNKENIIERRIWNEANI